MPKPALSTIFKNPFSGLGEQERSIKFGTSYNDNDANENSISGIWRQKKFKSNDVTKNVFTDHRILWVNKIFIKKKVNVFTYHLKIILYGKQNWVFIYN